MSRFFLILAILCAPLSSLLADPVSLRLERFDGPSPSFTSTGGTAEIRGPMSVRGIPEGPVPDGNLVLDLEYFCAGGVPAFAVLPGPPFEAATHRRLPALGHSETWSPCVARLNPAGHPLPAGWKELRFDLPLKADQVLQIRNARLRLEAPGDFAAKASLGVASIDAATLEEYLSEKFPAEISKVTVGNDTVSVSGVIPPGEFYLADVPMEFLINDPSRFDSLIPVEKSQGGFSMTIPRHRKRGAEDFDRLLCRWEIVRKSASGYEAVSHGHYADDVACRSPQLPAAHPKSKKGLGGWNPGRFPDELEELGISAVTVNMMVHSLVSLTAGPGLTPFQWQRKTYYANDARLADFDRTFLEAAKHDVMVSVILLIANPAKDNNPVVAVLGHPDAVKEGTFAMPNVTSPEGLALYGAILNLMAERWSRPDGKHGRVHHWIIHNEVDAGWVWTNAGEKADIVYMDLYQRSMRLTDLISRQYDPNMRPFITLTHHWAKKGETRWYGSKRLTDLLVRFCHAEGDFPWAMAYHPYPQNLFNPRTWEDEQATFTFETAKITPKNLEVLDAYMKQPALLYRGKVRPVHLSENGFNSKDYSPASLEDQAAGMALAWKKMAALSSIESWQYHNWIDNRGEGGLKIGLRKFPDEPGDPAGKKPIWHLYQALGTSEENEVAEPYLKTIGIRSWDEAVYRKEIR
ncbi:MAG: hypothetical protein EOP88_07180 [Verrucomicrobiaceae bacterium]|nr:MAG: hypothetical protein EOP88_07180 [Verrucomicrobiaceae bacterium]